MFFLEFIKLRLRKRRRKIPLFADLLDSAPVLVGASEPLAVPRADVDVDGGEAVVLLVSGCTRARHFHVQLHGVHPQHCVAEMRQHVAACDQTAEWGHFG